MRRIVTTPAFCLLLGASVLSSCRKDNPGPDACTSGCATISGRFSTDNRRTPLAGMVVNLEWWRATSWVSSEKKFKARAVTDAQGNYTLRFSISDLELQDGTFQVVNTADVHQFLVHPDNEGPSWSRLRRDTLITAPDWLVPRTAFIHPKITNPTQLAGYFGASYSYARGPQQGPAQLSNRAQVDFRYLPAKDVEVAANQPIEVRTNKLVNGQWMATRDTIEMAPGFTYVHRVTY